MVLTRKLNTSQLDLAAYEQYGDHHRPDVQVALRWAPRTKVNLTKKGSAS